MMAAASFAGARGDAQPGRMQAHRKQIAARTPWRFSQASAKDGGRRGKFAGKAPTCPGFVSEKEKS
jgi:hypothetical protein